MNDELWEKCVAFHGHECPGLTIGYRASLYAMQLLDLGHAEDEQIVCVSENDACGNDAIQVLLGCTVGKGNLLFHITGKQAFSFYERSSGRSVRLVLKKHEFLSREETFDAYQSMPAEEMFEIKPTVIELPERARIFRSYVCVHCGETAGENWIRLVDGRYVCIDCIQKYDRFSV